MQRVRIGLTGLACVFLLVLLGAAFLGLASNEPPVAPLSPTTAPRQISETASPGAETPKDPLAELGVAPGNAPDTPEPKPAAAPRPARP